MKRILEIASGPWSRSETEREKNSTEQVNEMRERKEHNGESMEKVLMLNLLEAALFTQEPELGSTDCTHEVRYAGYKRVQMVADSTTNLTEIVFPESEQDEEVLVTHAAAIDGRGVIRGVYAL